MFFILYYEVQNLHKRNNKRKEEKTIRSKNRRCCYSGHRSLIVSDAAAAQHSHGDGHQCSHGWTVEGGKGEIPETKLQRKINKILSCWIVVWSAKTEKRWQAGQYWPPTAVSWHQLWQGNLIKKKFSCRKLPLTTYVLSSLSCMGCILLIRLIGAVS